MICSVETEAGVPIATMRQFVLGQIGPRLSSEPDLVTAYWNQIGTPAHPADPDLTVLYCSVRSFDQTFTLFEFVAGETLEGLVKRSDPACCERDVPLFCRLLDAFEGSFRNDGDQAVSGSDLELLDFGVARA